MERIISEIDWVNGISISLAVIGILSSVYFYVRGRKKKEPTYSIRNISVIEESVNEIEGLDISYKDAPISTLSIAKIAFYNAGKETIRREDMASISKLRIVPEDDITILQSKIVYAKNSANNFKLIQGENLIHIDFDYCDHEEGVVIQLMHTGKSSQSFDIHGNFQGVKSLKERSMNKSLIPRAIRPIKRLSKRVSSKYVKKFMLLILFVVPILLFIPLLNPKIYNDQVSFRANIIPLILVTILYWGMGITILRNRPPKGFDVFNED